MSGIHLVIPESIDTLPAGYHYGAHTSNPSQGWSGYYVIRDSDGAACTARLSPEAHVEEPTAAEIDAAIVAESAEDES